MHRPAAIIVPKEFVPALKKFIYIHMRPHSLRLLEQGGPEYEVCPCLDAPARRLAETVATERHGDVEELEKRGEERHQEKIEAGEATSLQTEDGEEIDHKEFSRRLFQGARELDKLIMEERADWDDCFQNVRERFHELHDPASDCRYCDGSGEVEITYAGDYEFDYYKIGGRFETLMSEGTYWVGGPNQTAVDIEEAAMPVGEFDEDTFYPEETVTWEGFVEEDPESVLERYNADDLIVILDLHR